MGNNIKVIHIVESLHKGAVENWLVRMFLFGQKQGYNLDWTFYCTEEFEGRLENEVTESGGKIIKSPSRWAKPKQFVKDLRCHLKSEKYTVMHCHHDLMSALYLLAARGLSLKKIVQIHNMDEHIPTSSKLKAAMTRFLFRRICWVKADVLVGISKHTLKRFILNNAFLKKKSKILYYGIGYRKFLESEKNKELFFERYNLPEEKKIVLFCARMDPAKNPLRALEIFNSLIKDNKNYHLLMVGKGGLEKDINTYIEEHNLKHTVNFVGWSDDIPFILKNSDLLLYPHQTYPMEGLGIILVETQLSGLPILASTGVSLDPFFMNNYKIISLKESNEYWCELIFDLTSQKKSDNEVVFENFRNSNFYMPKALENLLSLHIS